MIGLKLADLFFDAEVLEHSLDCDALLSNLHVDRENLEYSELEKYQLQHELIRSKTQFFWMRSVSIGMFGAFVRLSRGESQ